MDETGDYSLTFASTAEARFGKQVGEALVRTHGPSKCAGRSCCIHNPSPHHMREWPLNIRFDRGITERTCPHGIGHPDPDDAAYRRTLAGEFDEGIHGCDGCCRPVPSPGEVAAADELTALPVPVVEVSQEEGRVMLDRAAREHLGISGAEFLAKWDAGEYNRCDVGVVAVAMLIPFVR